MTTTQNEIYHTINLHSHELHQKVMLGASSDVPRLCFVFNDDITLGEGVWLPVR